MKNITTHAIPILRLWMAAAAVIAVGCETADNDDGDISEVPDEVSGDMTKTFTITIEKISQSMSVLQTGVFNTPLGDDKSGPATPGKSYGFSLPVG